MFGRYSVTWPTQEKPAGNGLSAHERIFLADPPGGVWLIVYHYRMGSVPNVDVRASATWTISPYVGDVVFSAIHLSPGQARIAAAIILDKEGPGYTVVGEAWSGGPWPSGVAKLLGEPAPSAGR